MTDETAGAFSCDQCPARYRTARLLGSHKATTHRPPPLPATSPAGTKRRKNSTPAPTPVHHNPELERRLMLIISSASTHLRRLPELLAAIRNMEVGYPTSVGYEGDRTSGHTTVLDTWCAKHLQEVDICQGQGHKCAGVPVPSVSDPTGEAAVIQRDAARAHERELGDIVTRLERDLRRLDRIGDLYLQSELTAKAIAALRAEAKDLCEIHHLAGFDVEALVYTDLSKAKKAKRRLEPKHVCRWCRDFGVAAGRWPTTTEATANARGQRVGIPIETTAR